METFILEFIGIALILFNIYRKRNDKEELTKMLKLAIPMIVILALLVLGSMIFPSE